MPTQHGAGSLDNMEGTAWGRKKNTNMWDFYIECTVFPHWAWIACYVSDPRTVDVHKITREGRDSCSKCAVPSLDQRCRANEAVPLTMPQCLLCRWETRNTLRSNALYLGFSRSLASRILKFPETFWHSQWFSFKNFPPKV